VTIETELTKAADGVGGAAFQPTVRVPEGGEIAAMLREKEAALNAQRKELDDCRHKLAVATESSERWRTRALRAEKDVE
jgi:hypothetical protein